jgi:hypothetical protein
MKWLHQSVTFNLRSWCLVVMMYTILCSCSAFIPDYLYCCISLLLVSFGGPRHGRPPAKPWHFVILATYYTVIRTKSSCRLSPGRFAVSYLRFQSPNPLQQARRDHLYFLINYSNPFLLVHSVAEPKLHVALHNPTLLRHSDWSSYKERQGLLTSYLARWHSWRSEGRTRTGRLMRLRASAEEITGSRVTNCDAWTVFSFLSTFIYRVYYYSRSCD